MGDQPLWCDTILPRLRAALARSRGVISRERLSLLLGLSKNALDRVNDPTWAPTLRTLRLIEIYVQAWEAIDA